MLLGDIHATIGDLGAISVVLGIVGGALAWGFRILLKAFDRRISDVKAKQDEAADRQQHVIKELTPNGSSIAAGTADLSLRDRLDDVGADVATLKSVVAELTVSLAQNTADTRATGASLEDHVISDARQFNEDRVERAKLSAVMEDRGTLISQALEAILVGQRRDNSDRES